MKALLMHRDQDFDAGQELPWNEAALTQDLELNTLLHGMAGKDEFLFNVARKALLSGLQNDVGTVLYRQEILKDCLRNPTVVRALYDLVDETIETKRHGRFGIFSRYPSQHSERGYSPLGYVGGQSQKAEGHWAKAQANQFESEGFSALLAMIEKELNDDYLATIRNHLKELKFPRGFT